MLKQTSPFLHADGLTESDGRPMNGLLKRLTPDDYALLAPHLESLTRTPQENLYHPGDHVEMIHFPCGPSLVSYLVTNEEGRDVESVLVGREGAVGGIVSLGHLPAYCKITV